MTAELFQDQLKVEGINFRGYGIVPKYVMFDTDLTLEAKAIYAYFCSYTGRGNTAFPGRDKILFDLKMSKKKYYHHFNLLIEQGYITVEQQLVKGLKSRNIYTIVSTPIKFINFNLDPQKEEKYSFIRSSGLKSLGYGMIPKAVMQDARLSVKSKGIYAFFSSLTGSGDSAFPLINDITYYLNISKTTYYKHYQPLLDFNYITATQRHIDGVLSSNEYILNEQPDTETSAEGDKDSKSKKVIKTSVAGPAQPSNSNQRPKKEDTVKEYTAKASKGQFIPKNQRFDQCPKKEDTVNEDTVKEDTNINSIDHQQSLKSISPSIFKSTEMEGTKDYALNPTDVKTSSVQLTNRAQIQDTVHTATDYNHICESHAAAPKTEQDEYTHSVFCLFNEALINMLSNDQPMCLNRQKVSCDMVNDKFVQCINNSCLQNNSFDMPALIKLASLDYTKGYQFNIENGTEIKNPLQYMKSCIWNAMLVGNIGLLKPNQTNSNDGTKFQNQLSKPKNRFNNFTQRNIDYAALEHLEAELLKNGYM